MLSASEAVTKGRGAAPVHRCANPWSKRLQPDLHAPHAVVPAEQHAGPVSAHTCGAAGCIKVPAQL